MSVDVPIILLGASELSDVFGCVIVKQIEAFRCKLTHKRQQIIPKDDISLAIIVTGQIAGRILNAPQVC